MLHFQLQVNQFELETSRMTRQLELEAAKVADLESRLQTWQTAAEEKEGSQKDVLDKLKQVESDSAEQQQVCSVSTMAVSVWF